MFTNRMHSTWSILCLATASLAWADELKQGRKDRYGDPLPERAVARLGTTRLRNGAGIFPIAYSPDGKLLASAGGTPWAHAGISSGDPSIRLWDVETRKEVRTLTEHEQGVSYLAFSPDRKTLAAICNVGGPVYLWDLSKNETPRQIELPNNTVLPVFAFSKNGEAIAVAISNEDLVVSGSDAQIAVYDVATLKVKQRFAPHLQPVTAVAYSPDGRFLATKSGISVQLWDAAKGDLVRTLRAKRYFAKQRLLSVPDLTFDQEPPVAPPMAFSPDSKLVAAVVEHAAQAVQVWNVADGKEVARLGHQGRILSLTFSPDNERLATTSQDNTVRVWNASTGKELYRLESHFGGYVWATFSPNGKQLATGCGANCVQLWDAATGKEIAPADAHASEIVAVAYSRDGKTVATVGRDCSLRTWNAKTGQSLTRHDLQDTLVSAVAVSADGNTFAVLDRDQQTIQVVDAASGKRLRQVDSLTTRPSLSSDGKMLAFIGSDGKPRVVDVASGKDVHVVDEKLGFAAAAIAISEDGKRLAIESSADEGPVRRLWSIGDVKEPLLVERGPFDENDDGRFAIATALRFSPDGRFLVAQYGPAGVDLHDAETGKRLRRIDVRVERTFTNAEQSVVFSPDGKHLALVDGTAKQFTIYEAATGKERCRLEGHRGPVWCLAFSPDCRHVVTGSWDTTALVWDTLAPLDGTDQAGLKPADLDQLWKDLADADAAKAHQAMRRLAAAPAVAVAALAERLKTSPEPDAAKLDQLVKDLDSDDFATREAASQRLAELGKRAERALRKGLEGNPSVEAQKRMEALLQGLTDGTEAALPERLREARAVELLEALGTAEARGLLETLASAKGEAALTLEAKAALRRLDRRP
jgi:WD40 repeat protein